MDDFIGYLILIFVVVPMTIIGIIVFLLCLVIPVAIFGVILYAIVVVFTGGG